MDQTSIDFDQNDEDILTYAVSDEALDRGQRDKPSSDYFVFYSA